MPIYNYLACKRCEAPPFEKFFKTFAEAEPFTLGADCLECGNVCIRGVEVPFNAHLLGNPDGYHKPSPTKRHSTKTVSEKQGNKFSIG